MIVRFLATIFFLLTIYPLFAQDSSPVFEEESVEPKISIKRTALNIILDRVLAEPAYFEGTSANNFWQYFPSDSLQANGQTEIYMTYDDVNIYVGVKCYSIDNDFITPSLRRDYSFRGMIILACYLILIMIKRMLFFLV